MAPVPAGDPRAKPEPGSVIQVELSESRKLSPEHRTQVRTGDVVIGDENFTVIAGPCAVESLDQAMTIARAVETAGAKVFRASLYKHRTSPRSFRGLREEGLDILDAIRAETGLLIDTEVLSSEQIELLSDRADFLRVGCRSMRNYELLSELGRTRKPVILKRSMSATLEELLLAAEYILAGGNERVVLCERGIRTFETYTRNTLDILAVPALKELSHLPVIVDPSHGTGIRDKVAPMARASIAAGADGLIVEVHHEPDRALSDGAQSLYPEQYAELVGQIRTIAEVIGRRV